MALRRDALAGAAEFINRVEAYARERVPLVATVGKLDVLGGAANVIAGEVTLTLDVRHGSDVKCRRAVNALVDSAERIARRRDLNFAWLETTQHSAIRCSASLSALLDESVCAVQKRSIALVSGAGHDAVAMAAVTPVAMLFVRCRDGLSHHPEEYAAPGDIEIALRVMVDFIERLATSER